MRTAALTRPLVAASAVAGLVLAGIAVAAPAVAVAAPTVVLNEIATDDKPDWVELYNFGEAAVDVSGWVVDHSAVAGETATIAAGTSIAAHGFLVVDFEDGFKKADTAHLYEADGTTVVDEYTWSAHGAPSWARTTDGGADWALTTAATKGSTNAPIDSGEDGDDDTGDQPGDGSGQPEPSAGVVINEVESDGDPDFVELANTTDAAVDVGGWIVNHTQKTSEQVVIAAGTSIPAHGLIEVVFPEGFKKADTAQLLLADGTTLVDSATWTAHVDSLGRFPDGTGAFLPMVATPGAANAAPIVLNEVESDGDPDFVELYNLAKTPVDVGGWIVNHTQKTSEQVVIAAGTTVPVGGVFEVVFPEGFKKADTAQLLLADGTTLVDSVTWTAHVDTLGRFPDGTGAWTATVATPAAPNAVAGGGTGGGDTPPAPTCESEAPSGSGAEVPGGSAWPGSADWTTVDAQCQFVTAVSDLDLSGLDIDPAVPDVLWAVKNKSYVYKLVQDGDQWVPATDDGWAAGKRLVFAGGLADPEASQPDTEAITVGPDGALYATTERDNASNKISKNTVLRYDSADAGTPYTNPGNGKAETVLEPTMTWDLTGEFQPSIIPAGSNKDQANLGFEGITWVPDSYLTAKGFVDERTGAAYDPTDYPLHGTGLYLLGLEKNDHVYAYALNSDGTFQQIADVDTDFSAYDAADNTLGVGLDLQWDPDLQEVWVVGDNAAGGSSELLGVGADGAFAVDATYDRPTGLENYNLEGFAIAPASTCVDGERQVLRSDDGNNGGHSLWAGTLDCDLAVGGGAQPGDGGDGEQPGDGSGQTPGDGAGETPGDGSGGLPGTGGEQPGDGGAPGAGEGAHAIIPVTTAHPGDHFVARFTGLVPGTHYTLILHSDPIVLADGTAVADGSLALGVTIPTDAPAGSHTLQLTADDGTVVSSSPITLAATTTSSLSSTGTDPLPTVGAAALFLLLGLALVTAPRLLRRR